MRDEGRQRHGYPVTLTLTLIGDEGVSAIATGLVTNEHLTYLDLSNNSFSDRGAEALGLMLEKNTTLKRLILDQNNLGERGGRAIFRTLQNAPRGREVSLEQCRYSWEKTEAWTLPNRNPIPNPNTDPNPNPDSTRRLLNSIRTDLRVIIFLI